MSPRLTAFIFSVFCFSATSLLGQDTSGRIGESDPSPDLLAQPTSALIRAAEKSPLGDPSPANLKIFNAAIEPWNNNGQLSSVAKELLAASSGATASSATTKSISWSQDLSTSFANARTLGWGGVIKATYDAFREEAPSVSLKPFLVAIIKNSAWLLEGEAGQKTYVLYVARDSGIAMGVDAAVRVVQRLHTQLSNPDWTPTGILHLKTPPTLPLSPRYALRDLLSNSKSFTSSRGLGVAPSFRTQPRRQDTIGIWDKDSIDAFLRGERTVKPSPILDQSLEGLLTRNLNSSPHDPVSQSSPSNVQPDPVPSRNANPILATCKSCNGSGLVRHFYSCASCFGRGVLSCEYCSGTGIVYYDNAAPEYCDACGGTGRYRCPRCLGWGYLSSTTACAVCGGTGTLAVRDASTRGTY